jgi:hypothetical protein
MKLDSINNEIVVKPPYIFKVFKIRDIEILSKGDIENTAIFYRYSQDYGRTTTTWIELTKENIRSERINPIRFFIIEYLITYVGKDSVKIFDINIIGDFQNVTLDAQKTNLFGVREDCNCLMLNIANDLASYELFAMKGESKTSMLLSNNDADLYQLSQQDISNLYQPYQQLVALDLLNKLSEDSVQIFGHDVIYVLTDPDRKGIDFTFHEYQLSNYVCEKMLKVSVENNNFPDNQISFNQYELSLFDTFEIQITKQDFKTAFGVDKRPGKDDLIWFCELNRLYRIEHAQPFKNFNNYIIYYRIILTKASDKKNIIATTQDMQNVLNDIMDNTTLAELTGLENMQDMKSVANTEQLRNKAQDTLRVDIYADVERENIMNASFPISRTHYDLSSVDYGANAVVYRNFKNFYEKSDNIGFMCWFKINNISTNEIFNFLHYFDDRYNTGLKIDMIGTSIIVVINDKTYDLSFGALLTEDVWYCLVVNIDQRQTLLTSKIYKRNVTNEWDAATLNSSKLLELYSMTSGIVPTVIEVDTDINASIVASDMKITNIRMFLDIIPVSNHKILNMEIIDHNYKYIIFSDNANKIYTLPFVTDSKNDYTKIRRGTRLDNGSINNDNTFGPKQ